MVCDSNWGPLVEFYVNENDIHRHRDKTTEMAGFDNRTVTSGCHWKTLPHQRAQLWQGGGGECEAEMTIYFVVHLTVWRRMVRGVMCDKIG